MAAEAVLAVQRAGYALEAQLVGVDALPPQHHTIDDLRGEDLWVAEDSGKIVHVLGVEDGAELVIARLVVDPACMRRGLGRVLARHALALAGDRFVRVGTAAANTPALGRNARARRRAALQGSAWGSPRRAGCRLMQLSRRCA